MRLLGAFEAGAQGVGEIADRVNVVHLAVGDETGEHSLVFRADLVSGEKGILPA